MLPSVDFAVIVVVPNAFAVTSPDCDTVATALFVELHESVWFVASVGMTPAVKVTSLPGAMVKDD